MKIRIGTGAGCSYDRIEPVEDLILHGNIDYIIFECLAERTMSDNMLAKMKNASKGYTPMLEERMERLLKISIENDVKIISNMGASNIEEAANIVKKVAQKQNIDNIRLGLHYGDDIKNQVIPQHLDLVEEQIISANAYLGYSGITHLLDEGCHVILTGRVADVSLFVAPIAHEFKEVFDNHLLAQATLLGHLMECGGQITGGYAADPGYKDIENLDNIGFPIAEIGEDGTFTISKIEGTGGEVSKRIALEQLSYEVFDLENYITPDACVDFSQVGLAEIGKDIVEIKGARYIDNPTQYKANVGYKDGYMGIAEISFAGSNSYEKAMLCKQIIEGRLKRIKAQYRDIRFDLLGYSSMVGETIARSHGTPMEVRLRMTVRTDTEADASYVTREMDFMYTNGPSGSSGIDTRVKIQIGIKDYYLAKNLVKTETEVVTL